MSSLPSEMDQPEVEVTAKDLPLHCPLPSQKLWNTHPRVFLDVAATGECRCPYCGTVYRLAGGAIGSGH
jgi:uncharacterized Zn-finger protein